MTQLFLLGTAIRKPRRGGGGGGWLGGGDCLPVSFKIFKTCLSNFRSAATKERKDYMTGNYNQTDVEMCRF